jgi:hypothetical protein
MTTRVGAHRPNRAVQKTARAIQACVLQDSLLALFDLRATIALLSFKIRAERVSHTMYLIDDRRNISRHQRRLHRRRGRRRRHRLRLRLRSRKRRHRHRLRLRSRRRLHRHRHRLRLRSRRRLHRHRLRRRRSSQITKVDKANGSFDLNKTPAK